MVEGYGENNPIVEKSQFIMSLVEQIDKHGVGPQHKSIIDRCTALVYQEAEETGIIPTLCTPVSYTHLDVYKRQNVRMGLDGRKHRRNLNTVVIGGSGAGKSFNLAKPNLMQANTSFVVLDPKEMCIRDRPLP